MDGLSSWPRTLITAHGNGPTLTAAAAASCLPTGAVYSVDPNTFREGMELEIEASGIISSVITTPGTARFDVRLGGTVIFDGLAVLLDTVAAHTSVGWRLKIELVCRAIGNAALTTFQGSGEFKCEDILGTPATAPKGSLTAMLPWNSTPSVGTGVNNSIANLLDLFFTQTVATGSMTLQRYRARIG
jgi:hypothetical protein